MKVLSYTILMSMLYTKGGAQYQQSYMNMKQRADIHIQTSGKCDQVAKKQHKIQEIIIKKKPTSRHR